MHITVGELQKLLETLPKDIRVAPSPGRWALTLWDKADEDPIGDIHLEQDIYVVDFYFDEEHNAGTEE